MKKRLFNKLTSQTYGVTPKMYKWFVQNNSKALGNEIKYPINFSVDEQIKFNKKHCKRTVKKMKVLIRHFSHFCSQKSLYIDIGRNCAIQIDKLIIRAVETNDYVSALKTEL